jgi:hypothetical protein
MEMCFSLSSMASGTFGRPSGNRSPFHSAVKALMYSGDEPTRCALTKKLTNTNAAKNIPFLIIMK